MTFHTYTYFGHICLNFRSDNLNGRGQKNQQNTFWGV